MACIRIVAKRINACGDKLDKFKRAHWSGLFAVRHKGGSDSQRILARLENSGKTQPQSALLARLRPRHLALGLAVLAAAAAALACATYFAMIPGA